VVLLRDAQYLLLVSGTRIADKVIGVQVGRSPTVVRKASYLLLSCPLTAPSGNGSLWTLT
jgi:hypothetical protein